MYPGAKKVSIFSENPLTNRIPPVQSLNTEHRTQNTEHRTQNTEHRTQNTEHRTYRRNPFKYSKYIWSMEASGTIPQRRRGKKERLYEGEME